MQFALAVWLLADLLAVDFQQGFRLSVVPLLEAFYLGSVTLP